MPDIALDFRAIEYVTDLGVTVRAMRAFVDVEFPTQAGTTVDFDYRRSLQRDPVFALARPEYSVAAIGQRADLARNSIETGTGRAAVAGCFV